MKLSSPTIFFYSIAISITSLISSTVANAVPVLNGIYFQSPPKGEYELIEVRGNRFRFIYEGSDPSDPVDPWKSNSKLKSVKKGVILHGNKYFCSRNIYPVSQYCTVNGGKGRF
jgi:hypothetical protein